MVSERYQTGRLGVDTGREFLGLPGIGAVIYLLETFSYFFEVAIISLAKTI